MIPARDRARRRLVDVVGIVLGLAVSAGSARATETPSLRAVLDTHLCDLGERLARIHRSPEARRTARHIIVSPEDRPDAYVQCRFVEKDTRMICEATSGYYATRSGRRAPHPGDRAALDVLGFRAQPDGNDVRTIDLGGPEDLGMVAALMLRALHDGYGFRVPTPLLVKAPLARLPAPASAGCIPVS